jgi:hypothetical protein
MPRTANVDQVALTGLLSKQYCLLTRGQALACGITKSMVERRLRIGGRWQVMLPGVYLTLTGEPTFAQREMAALLYAGSRSMITGPAALITYGVRVEYAERVDVLVPASTQRKDHVFVRLHRTERMPVTAYLSGEISFVPVARAVVDAARAMNGIREVRAVVADAVQRSKCPLAMLMNEVREGPRQGSALLRQALAEVAGGIRSTTEGDLRDLIKRGGLPMPMFNASLYIGDQFIARPDCWWPDAGVAAEADSREWHLSPRDWERTLARHALMSAHGIVVLHFTPQQVRSQRAAVVANLRSALSAGRGRPPLPIRAVPCGQGAGG